MQITDLSESKKQVKINIDKDRVGKERDSIINRIRQEAHIDGFRKGKIPLELLKQRFKDVIDGRLTQNLIYETSEKVLKEQNWNCVGMPEIKNIVFGEDGDMNYEMTVEIIPKLNIKDWTGMKLKKNIDLRKEVRRQLAMDNQFEPPESLVKRRINANCSDEEAKIQVRASLVLKEIAVKENIAVLPQEIEEEVRKIVQVFGGNINGNLLLPAIEETIKEEKALDLVIAKAEIEKEAKQ